MSVLMFLNVSEDDDDDTRWPSDEAVERYRWQTAESGRAAVQVFDDRTGPKFIVEAVDREFRLSDSHGHGVRVMLTGYRDPALAKRMYQERGLPVNVLYSRADLGHLDSGHWSHESWPDEGITVTGWNCPPADDDLDVIDYVLQFFNDLTSDYQWYARYLRDVPSGPAAADVDGSVYASIMDAFGDHGVQAVEPVLDAVLKQLCGAVERDESANSGDRWTSASGVVEEGDRAAEDAARLVNCFAAAAVDYTRRTTRVATSFASTFWRDYAGTPTAADRVMAECLVENLRSVSGPKLDELSDEQFAMCLNAKFIATRLWRPPTGSADLPQAVRPRSLFRPEIRERCEKFFAVDHLLDLSTSGDDAGHSVFAGSHVEHLEPYVLPQKLVDYASRYFGYQVRYFALADTLVFRFTDGGRGRFVEQSHVHRLAGPKNFKQFHDEAFRNIDIKRPLAVTDPNVFRYREPGYVDVSDHAVHYVSSNGDTRVRAEVFRFRNNDDDVDADGEWRYRMKVECGDFWVTVQSVWAASAAGDDVDRQTELTAVMTDGTVVAVTRSPGRRGFDVTARTADGRVVDRTPLKLQQYVWPDGRPLLECFDDVATVTAADGTTTSADFGRAERFVCVAYLMDGARVRMSLTGPIVRFCRGDSSDEPVTADDVKYLVCRRDLSGYEFVDDLQEARPKVNYDSPVTVVRTLTRSPFDDRTSGLVDEAVADHLLNVKTVADRLNAGWSGFDDDDDDDDIDGDGDGDGDGLEDDGDGDGLMISDDASINV